MNDAYRVGITDAMRFYAPDAHVDKRFINYEGVGRAGFAQALRDNAQNPPTWTGGRNTTDRIDLVPTEPLYLSRDRFLEPLRRIDPTIVPAIDAAFLYTVGAAGLTDETILGSAESGMWTSQGAAAGDVRDLARGYLDGWASAESRAVLGRYAADATLTDSLADRRITGASAIAAEAGGTLGPLAAWGHTARNLRRRRRCCLHLWALRRRHRRHGSTRPAAGRARRGRSVRGQSPSSCGWTHQRITREERLHRIDSVRRCTTPGQRPSGWWDSIRPPTTQPITRTGTLHPGAHDIAVWNGDPRIDPIIDWAQERFAQLGLPPPEPTSVTFLPPVDGDRWDEFGFLTGADAPDLGLPFTADEACPDGPCRWPTKVRAATLHEFAHLYLAPSVYGGMPSYDVPREPRARRGVPLGPRPDVARPGLSWGQQGNERAAETIAWGLMDQRYTVDPRLGPLTCAQLTADFQTLTTTTPDLRACAEPKTDVMAP